MSEIEVSWCLGGRHVLVAGSFSGWKAIPMIRDEANDRWYAKIKNPTNSPTFYYKFIADGVWCYDYRAETVVDPQGYINNVGTVAKSSEGTVEVVPVEAPKAEESPKTIEGKKATEGPKTLAIIRGASGCGKTTLAQKLLQENSAKVHAEADKKMLNHKGEYVFNPKNLGAAHAGCVSDIAQGMKEGEHFLVVSNTSTCYWEMYEYVRLALQHNYEIRFVEPDTEWSKNADVLFEKNSHAVPIASIKNQLDNLAKNPTLPTKEMIPKILATMGCRPCTYRPGINNFRFFSYGVPADKIATHIQKLKQHLGEQEYNIHYKNLCSRDGGINEQFGTHIYHITLSSFEMEEDKYFADDKNKKNYTSALKQLKTHPTFLGVGRVQKGEDVSFFVVAEWPEFATLRQNLSLKPLNLHISLGFKPNDLHDLPKDKSTIFLK